MKIKTICNNSTNNNETTMTIITINKYGTYNNKITMTINNGDNNKE